MSSAQQIPVAYVTRIIGAFHGPVIQEHSTLGQALNDAIDNINISIGSRTEIYIKETRQIIYQLNCNSDAEMIIQIPKGTLYAVEHQPQEKHQASSRSRSRHRADE